MATITIEIKTENPNQRHSVATRKAREACAAAGVEWIDADVMVKLPEQGRCMTKAPGFTSLTAHG